MGRKRFCVELLDPREHSRRPRYRGGSQWRTSSDQGWCENKNRHQRPEYDLSDATRANDSIHNDGFEERTAPDKHPTEDNCCRR